MIEFKVTMTKKDVVMKRAMEALKKQITERLKNVKCPDHHQRPRVIVSGSVRNPDFKIEGCCQKLIDEALKALK